MCAEWRPLVATKPHYRKEKLFFSSVMMVISCHSKTIQEMTYLELCMRIFKRPDKTHFNRILRRSRNSFDPGECCSPFTWWDIFLHRVNCLRASSKGSMSFQIRTGLASQREPKTSFQSCWFEMQHCASAPHKSSSTRGCRGWEPLHLRTENGGVVCRHPPTLSPWKLACFLFGELIIFFFSRMPQREVFQLLVSYKGTAEH